LIVAEAGIGDLDEKKDIRGDGVGVRLAVFGWPQQRDVRFGHVKVSEIEGCLDRNPPSSGIIAHEPPRKLVH
jgi:hypothetical protein